MYYKILEFSFGHHRNYRISWNSAEISSKFWTLQSTHCSEHLQVNWNECAATARITEVIGRGWCYGSEHRAAVGRWADAHYVGTDNHYWIRTRSLLSEFMLERLIGIHRVVYRCWFKISTDNENRPIIDDSYFNYRFVWQTVNENHLVL